MGARSSGRITARKGEYIVHLRVLEVLLIENLYFKLFQEVLCVSLHLQVFRSGVVYGWRFYCGDRIRCEERVEGGAHALQEEARPGAALAPPRGLADLADRLDLGDEGAREGQRELDPGLGPRAVPAQRGARSGSC